MTSTNGQGHTKWLSAAQISCLKILAANKGDYMVNYGTGCGVKRNVAQSLSRRGFVFYLPEVRNGVSVRISPEGRAALSRVSGEGR